MVRKNSSMIHGSKKKNGGTEGRETPFSSNIENKVVPELRQERLPGFFFSAVGLKNVSNEVRGERARRSR